MSLDVIGIRDSLPSFIAATVLQIVALVSCRWIALSIGKRFVRENFLRQTVASVGGIAFVPVVAFFFSTRSASDSIDIVGSAVSNAAVGFGILGLIDDLFGDRSASGFRGHFRALFHQRKVTTGAIKAIGGGLTAIAIAYELNATKNSGLGDALFTIASQAVLISLAANSANLLDLRPGRCVAVGIAALCPLLLSTFLVIAPAYPLISGYDSYDFGFSCCVLMGCLVGLYLFDRNAWTMLGDAGSNAIGAGVGVLYAVTLSLWGVAIGVVLLLLFQFWCEKHSLTKFIESHPTLRAIDRKIGVREQTTSTQIE